jgi:hypothetical protein
VIFTAIKASLAVGLLSVTVSLLFEGHVYNTSFYYFRIKFKLPKSYAVVLYGCETWSLTLREEHRLRVFEQGVRTGF